jgi:hypothetical protein
MRSPRSRLWSELMPTSRSDPGIPLLRGTTLYAALDVL